MHNRLLAFLNIKPGEGSPVLLLTAYYFFITAISIAGRSVSNALFFSRVPNAEALFPLMLIPITLTTTLTVAVYSRLARRMPLLSLLAVTGTFFSAVLLVLLPLLGNWWATVLLYVWMEVLNIVLFFQFYIFAGTIFDTRQAKRIFAVLGIGGALATVLSGLALKPFTARFGSEAVLIVTVAFVLLSLAMAWRARRYVHQELVQPVQPEQTASRQRVRLDSYLKTIIAVLAATILVATIVDYQYKVIANRHFSYDERLASGFAGLSISAPSTALTFNVDEVGLTAFFGSVAALVGVLQLGLRLFVVGKLLTRFGILAGLILLPVVIGINSTLVLLVPVLITATLLKVFDQALRFTLNETTMELLWVPVSPARKLAFKPFISGTVPSILQGVAGVLIFTIVTLFADNDVQIISLVILVVVILWIPLAWRLRRGYVNELMTSIQQRQLVLEELDLTKADATVIATIEHSLQSDDEVERAFTLSLIENSPLGPWAKPLNRMFIEGDFFIRQKILRMGANYPEIISDEDLLNIIRAAPGDMTDEAIIAAGKRHLTAAIPLLQPHLRQRERPAIRAAAARAIIMMNEGPLEMASSVLQQMLEVRDANQNVMALNTLASLPKAVVNEAVLRKMLMERSIRTRALILQVIENPDYLTNDTEIIKIIAQNLEKPATRSAAQRVLKNYAPTHVVAALIHQYTERSSSEEQHIGIAQTLAQYPQAESVSHLIRALDIEQVRLYSEIINALLQIARQQPLTQEQLANLEGHTMALARAIYERYHMLALLGENKEVSLLADTLDSEINLMLPTLLKLSVMDVPETHVETLIERLQPKDKEARYNANVLEILDNVLSRSEREVIIPLFEKRQPQDVAAIGKTHFADLPPNLDRALAGIILSGDKWRSLVALDFALRQPREALLASLNWMEVPNSPQHLELLKEHLENGANSAVGHLPASRFPLQERTKTMYTLLEKTIILKRVPIFEEIEPHELFHIAQIAEEQQLEEGQVIFNEDDSSDGLYIIVEGTVSVHKGGKQMTELGRNDSLGEMSLFDHLPRSASATTLTQTTLFKISIARFRELLLSHVEIMEAIIKTLSLRLRAANQQMATMNQEITI